MGISQLIQQAIDTSDEIRIIYHGGSQPGSVRNIIPIALTDDKLRARCMASGKTKTFVINRIELPDDSLSSSVPRWQAGQKFHSFNTIANLFDTMRDTLEGMGWFIEHDEAHIALHRYFKNGKARKAINVLISFEEFKFDHALGIDNEWHEANKQKRPRPWSVFAAPNHHSSFKEFEAAALRFMEWAAKLAPINGEKGS